MPFKTRYDIYGRVTAPVVSTYDKKIARIEWNSYLRNPHTQGIHRLVQTVEPDGELTKSEEYLYLVYRVRKLWRRYFDCGRKKEDLEESLKLESELDAWNMRTKIALSRRDISTMKFDDKQKEEAYNFYVVVQAWRDAWKERKRYSGHLNCDKQVLNEMGRKCRQYEKEIDQYIKTKTNLI